MIVLGIIFRSYESILERGDILELAHNAIIIDERTKEGVHVTIEGQPSHLGQELRLIFHPTKPLVLICREIHQDRQLKSPSKLEPFYPLTKTEVEIALLKGRKGLRSIGFNVKYLYLIKDDGIYTECRETEQFRKVKDTKAEQVLYNSPIERYKRAFEESMLAVGKVIVT